MAMIAAHRLVPLAEQLTVMTVAVGRSSATVVLGVPLDKAQCGCGSPEPHPFAEPTHEGWPTHEGLVPLAELAVSVEEGLELARRLSSSKMPVFYRLVRAPLDVVPDAAPEAADAS